MRDHGRVEEPDYTAEIRAVGRASGLDAVGVAPADPFLGTRVHLERRRERGLHGGMRFTYKNPVRSTDPSAALPGAQTLVVGAWAYRRPSSAPATPPGPTGRVARYVWADHYGELRAALGTIAARLKADGWRARVLVDQNDLVDREAAYRAVLGWYGKNSNLLLPGHGSWFVLGSVVTDAPLTPSAGPVADGCGSCDRCVEGCPTRAIVAPGVIDARRCLAWLVQAPGDIPREHRVAMGDRMYGCDDCQDVCPPNRVERRRTGDDGVAAAGRAWVPLLAVLDAADAELLERYGHWYIPERSPRYLRRNALVALGNAADADDPDVRHAVERHLAHPDPMLRAHAVWAARRLGLHDLVAAMPVDAEPGVRDELAAPAPPPRVPAR